MINSAIVLNALLIFSSVLTDVSRKGTFIPAFRENFSANSFSFSDGIIGTLSCRKSILLPINTRETFLLLFCFQNLCA